MGHRRFVKEDKQPDVQHPYTRTPNPQARNYFDEMAPVNGTVQYDQAVYDAANKEREAMRDAVSKRMGELLLRGVTMLDAYCQTCNGILMGDRNKQQTCVTCEIYSERVGKESPAVSKAIEQLGEKEEPEEKPAVFEPLIYDPFYLDQSERIRRRDESKVETALKKPAPPPAVEAKPSPLSASSSQISLPGYAAAVRAVDNKLAWAADRLAASTDLYEARELLALISEAMTTIRNV